MQFAPTQSVRMNQKAYVGVFVNSLTGDHRGPRLQLCETTFRIRTLDIFSEIASVRSRGPDFAMTDSFYYALSLKIEPH